MILPNFMLPTRVNQRWTHSGIDRLVRCLDKTHYLTYPHKIDYKFNSRGFRDQEWPVDLLDLQTSIWCVGDSFTEGLGSPIEHTWPYLLKEKTKINTINVSMDGASNNWISRKTVDILEQITPNIIVIQWSYFHRRENENTRITAEYRTIHYELSEINDTESDLTNFAECFDRVNNANKNSIVIHSAVPWASDQQSHQQYMQGSNVHLVIQEDYARDSHHYDIKTSSKFVDYVIQQIN